MQELLCAITVVASSRYAFVTLRHLFARNCCNIFQDIRGAGITGAGDRDWAPNPAFDFSIQSFDSKPQDGYGRFDLKRMAQDKMGPQLNNNNQSFETEQHHAKNQSQALQRQVLEQQIAENAARKEVI